MRFLLYIKSHTELPDYEDEVEADSEREAIEKFLENLNYSNEDPWDEEMIIPYIERVNE